MLIESQGFFYNMRGLHTLPSPPPSSQLIVLSVDFILSLSQPIILEIISSTIILKQRLPTLKVWGRKRRVGNPVIDRIGCRIMCVLRRRPQVAASTCSMGKGLGMYTTITTTLYKQVVQCISSLEFPWPCEQWLLLGQQKSVAGLLQHRKKVNHCAGHESSYPQLTSILWPFWRWLGLST